MDIVLFSGKGREVIKLIHVNRLNGDSSEKSMKNFAVQNETHLTFDSTAMGPRPAHTSYMCT